MEISPKSRVARKGRNALEKRLKQDEEFVLFRSRVVCMLAFGNQIGT